MKNLIKTLAVALASMFMATSIFAQSPEKMSYQAVIRNVSGELVTTQVGVKLSILKGTDATSATEEYSETFTPTPNPNGLVSIEFGGGTGWDVIDWSNGKFFIKTETDIDNDAAYDIEGVSQLLSVPYALYAAEAGNIPDVSGFATQSALEDSVSDVRADIPDVSGIATNTTAISENVQAIQDTANSIRSEINIESLLEQLEELQLETGLKIQDIEGNIYKTLTIGTQTWMAENLRATKLNNGTPLPNITDNTEWGSLTEKAYCWYDNDSITYSQTYGALYNGYAVETGELCPSGWHVPSDDEWKTLEMYLGMTQVEADKSSANRGVNEGAKLATNGNLWNNGYGDLILDPDFDESGFDAIPAGKRYDSNSNGVYWGGGKGCYFHSSDFIVRSLYYSNPQIWRKAYAKVLGQSVRCIKD